MEERASTSIEPWSWGRGYFHADFPTKWDLNYLRLIERPNPGEASAIVAEAETIFGQKGFRHRKIHHDSERGADLVEAFEKLGWTAETLEIMVLERPSDVSTAVEVEEISPPEIRPPAEEWYRQTLVISEEDAANLAGSVRAVEEAVNVRYFAVRHNGKIVSWCHLYQEDGVAQIEEVSTFEPYRNRGLARATISTAIRDARESGANFVFLVADANDWPKQLYLKLGFTPVGRIYEYTRIPKD